MRLEYRHAQHVHVPDRGHPYAKGDHVDLGEGPDSRLNLRPNRHGKYLIVSCTPRKLGGVKLLDVGLYRRC
jgi:hypothetical protein